MTDLPLLLAFTLLSSPVPSPGPAALLLAIQDEPVCVFDHIVTSPQNGVSVTLEWADTSRDQRRVTVVFSADGEPLRYSELKTSGALASFDRVGSYRLVYMNFESGLGVVELQESGLWDRIQEQREISEIFMAEELGMPSQTIRQVKAMCTEL